MAMEPLCASAKALGHSWPSIHWWLSLNAADQGAWVAGLGAFAAAFAALWISDQDRRRRKWEQSDRADVCAHYVTIDLQRLADSIVRLRRALLSIDLSKQHSGFAREIYSIEQCVEDITRVRARIDINLMLILPTKVGQQVALAIGSLPLVCDAASMVAFRMRAADEIIMQSQENFSTPAAMTRSAIAGFAAFFRWHMERFPEARSSVSEPVLRKLEDGFDPTNNAASSVSGDNEQSGNITHDKRNL